MFVDGWTQLRRRLLGIAALCLFGISLSSSIPAGAAASAAEPLRVLAEASAVAKGSSLPLDPAAPLPATEDVTAPDWWYQPQIEWEKRINADERLRSFGPGLFGDRIDPHTGSIVFEQTDVSLPGNSGLEVALRRRRSSGFLYNKGVDAEFGDWEYLVPRISVITAASKWAHPRCTGNFAASLPQVTAAVGGNGSLRKGRSHSREEYSQGVVLEIPGAGAQQVLENKQGAHWPSGARFVTADNWIFDLHGGDQRGRLCRGCS